MKTKNVMLKMMIVCVFICPLALGQASDDRYTVGLWRMDSSDYYETSTRVWISDYDALNPGRDNNMVYGITSDSVSWPQLSEAGAGYDGVGEAMVYSGEEISFAFIGGDYGNYENVRIEFWFYKDTPIDNDPDDGETLLLLGDQDAGWPWEVRLRQSSGSQVYLFVQTVDDGVKQVRSLFEMGVWNKVVAVIDQDSNQVSLKVTPEGYESRTANTALPSGLIQVDEGTRNGRLYMGAQSNSANVIKRPFTGMLDNVKVSKIAQYPELEDDASTIGLWKMNNEDVFTENSETYMKDHDDFTGDRGNDLLLPADPNFTPEVLSDALVFSPDSYSIAQNAWQGYDTVKIDLWLYHSGDILSEQTLITAGGASGWAYELRLRRSSGNRLYFYAQDASENIQNLNPIIDVNVWNHVVASVDADTGEMSLTITPLDGSPVTQSNPGFGNFLGVNGDIWLGCTRNPGSKPLNAVVDDVKVSLTGDTCGLWGYSVADFNQDCLVDSADLVEFASYWLESSLPQ